MGVFTPASSVVLSVSTSSSRVSIGAGSTGERQMRLVSNGSGLCAFATGDSTITAAIPTGTASANVPFLLGSDVVFTIPAGHSHVAMIADSGVATTSVHITLGMGE